MDYISKLHTTIQIYRPETENNATLWNTGQTIVIKKQTLFFGSVTF